MAEIAAVEAPPRKMLFAPSVAKVIAMSAL
jgi:hypothetical protein